MGFVNKHILRFIIIFTSESSLVTTIAAICTETFSWLHSYKRLHRLLKFCLISFYHQKLSHEFLWLQAENKMAATVDPLIINMLCLQTVISRL